MAEVYTAQYQPVSNYEVGTNKPLTVRAIRDLTDSILNAKAHVFNHKIRSYLPRPSLQSMNSTTEVVKWCFTPVFVPKGYNKITLSIGHYLTSGSTPVTWRVYSLQNAYVWTNIMNTSMAFGGWNSVAFNSTSNAHNIAVLNVPLQTGSTDLTWLVVTSQKSAADETISKITTLDAWPVM